ncbi:MAG: hypothetical protein AMS17_09055 [Spirochaetes bacterium DG_61]|jgi:hypothetical protein|nr:MAG: hypothetical protein AMS17_09055 [Spirochaetes bacterium DG_61]
MMRMNVRESIFSIFRFGDRVKIANTLMTIPDREIAVPLLQLEGRERELILSLLSPAKAERVREEIGYQETLYIPRDRYLIIVNKFLSYFEPGKSDHRDSSYIRPKRRR